MTATDSIYEDVKAIVAQILCLEPEQITPKTRFFNDLGGESIEWLELNWHCEQRFKIKAPFQDFLGRAALETDGNGLLTATSMATLRQRLPTIERLASDEPLPASQVVELVTVEAIAHVVREAIAATRASAIGDTGSSGH